MSEKARNALGGELADCSERPLTGFFRDGCCNTSAEDRGSHTVCVLMTAEFLAFSRARGNDLSTPVPKFEFPGLKPGDRWCLCAARWQEAFAAGKAPRVVLQATHERALDDYRLEDLKRSFANLRFTLEERDPDTEDLASLAAEVCAMLKPRLDESGDLATEAQARTEDDSDDSDEDEIEQEASSGEAADEGGDEQLEIDVGQSKLRAFYDFLQNSARVEEYLASETKRFEEIRARKARTRAEREFVRYTPEQRLKLSLVSLLKPAMIVDGQHRVWGAYRSSSAPIVFNVCAIKDASWVEQVFQFVILNKLARPISSSFLTALLNTSLTNEELTDIEPRLDTVGIRNTDRVLMKYVNFDARSPFFETVSQPGDMAGVDNQGRLSDKGILRVAKRWYNLQANTPELRMFLPSMGEIQLGKARSRWQKHHEIWTTYFFAFWRTLRDKYEKVGVWEKREKFNLLYIVTLLTLQDMFLEAKAKGDAQFGDVDDFTQQVVRFFERVPGTFFMNWEATGLQSGDGPRYIKNAVEMLREGKQFATARDNSELFRKV